MLIITSNNLSFHEKEPVYYLIFALPHDRKTAGPAKVINVSYLEPQQINNACKGLSLASNKHRIHKVIVTEKKRRL